MLGEALRRGEVRSTRIPGGGGRLAGAEPAALAPVTPLHSPKALVGVACTRVRDRECARARARPPARGRRTGGWGCRRGRRSSCSLGLQPRTDRSPGCGGERRRGAGRGRVRGRGGRLPTRLPTHLPTRLPAGRRLAAPRHGTSPPPLPLRAGGLSWGAARGVGRGGAAVSGKRREKDGPRLPPALPPSGAEPGPGAQGPPSAARVPGADGGGARAAVPRAPRPPVPHCLSPPASGALGGGARSLAENGRCPGRPAHRRRRRSPGSALERPPLGGRRGCVCACAREEAPRRSGRRSRVLGCSGGESPRDFSGS